ncbi:MAG: LEA type 2 family protein [Polyangiaceae bacterium]|nr:LEA type 2 family protein [Polyangiaceae bacterium]
MMRRRHLATAAIGSFFFAAILAACSKPEPPTITPEGAVVKAVTPAGLDVEMTIDAYNPNKVPLMARSVKAKVMLGKSIDLGEVTVPTKIEVPAGKHEKIVAPMSLKWTDAAAVGMLALQHDTVPFTIEGTASVGIDELNFDVPFETDGTLTRQQLMEMAPKSLPQLPKLPF